MQGEAWVKKKAMKIKKSANQRGFTIIELMIALTVLSTLLLMSTVILIQIGALYMKGVNSANLQNASRTILADVSSSLQFTGNDISYGTPQNYPGGLTVNAVCIGSTRYSYVQNRELGTDFDSTLTNHVLWRDTLPNAGACSPLDISAASVDMTTKGYEMVPQHMRLVNFTISQDSTDPTVFTVTVWMAYGDTDLLGAGYTTCKGGSGQQFCGTTQLSTTVKRRITQ